MPLLESLLQTNPTFLVASNIVRSLETLVTFETSYKLFAVFHYNDTRGLAYNLWRHIAKSIAALGPNALPMIREALHSEHENVRGYAARILGMLGGDEAYKCLVASLEDLHASVRVQIIQSLVYMKQKEILPLLHKELQDPADVVRACVFQALQDLEDKELVSLSYRFVTDSYWKVRYLCIHSIAHTDGVKSIPTLLQLMKDPNHTVRYTAIRYLGQLGDMQLLTSIQRQIEAIEPLEFGGNDLRSVIREIIERKIVVG